MNIVRDYNNVWTEMKDANLDNIGFDKIDKEEKSTLSPVFFKYWKLDFKNLKTKSLNIPDFMKKFRPFQLEIDDTLSDQWTKRNEAKKLPHINNLQTLGVTVCEADANNYFILEIYAKLVLKISKHIVSKFQLKKGEIKDNDEYEDPLCFESFPKCYVVNLMQLVFDRRVRHIFSRAFANDIIQQCVQFYGVESIKVVEFGATVLVAGAPPGPIHSDYEIPPIPATGILTNLIYYM